MFNTSGNVATYTGCRFSLLQIRDLSACETGRVQGHPVERKSDESRMPAVLWGSLQPLQREHSAVERIAYLAYL